MNNFFAILVLSVPLTAVAGKTECRFFAEMVNQRPPSNVATVAAYHWDSGYDKKISSEHTQTLRILYKNGDHAVIKHQYCMVYRLEINYFRNRQADDLDAKAIATLVASLYSQYYSAPEKVTFSTPLTEIIATTLITQNFDRKKDFESGLPDGVAEYPQQDLNYSISYKPLDKYKTSGIYSSVIRFYMGIGGVP